MADVTIFHNPSCSNSRGALALLAEHDVDREVVEYLKAPPTRSELEEIVRLVPNPPADLVRKDKRFTELGLAEPDYTTADAVVDLLLAHPDLMQRPIVVRGDRAVIARPPESVLELLK